MESQEASGYKPTFPNHISYLGGSVKEEPKEYSNGNSNMELPISSNTTGSKKFVRPNPHRKYSQKWFSYAWDTAVQLGKWPRITYFAIGIILVGVWVGIMLAFARDQVAYERRNANQVNRGRSVSESIGLAYYKGTLRKFDPVERSLKVSWSIVFVDDDGKLNDFGTTPNTTIPINIYRDVKAVPETRNSTLVDASALFRVDNITQPAIAVLGKHPFDSVDTDIDFTQAQPDNPWRQPLFAYPFDRWVGSIVLAATDRNSADITNLTNSFIVEISDALLTDSTLNWRISSNTNNTCQVEGDFAGCELHIDFAGGRPGLVVFAALVAVIVNWTSTIGIFLITCESVVMRRTYILTEIDILGVCLTALFALPSVRAILPGAPDFGAIIDLIGIIPNIIIISLCTTAVAISRLRMPRPEKED